jgi:hypothetical protein
MAAEFIVIDHVILSSLMTTETLFQAEETASVRPEVADSLIRTTHRGPGQSGKGLLAVSDARYSLIFRVPWVI